jgi:hypothetical protein
MSLKIKDALKLIRANVGDINAERVGSGSLEAGQETSQSVWRSIAI